MQASKRQVRFGFHASGLEDLEAGRPRQLDGGAQER